MSGPDLAPALEEFSEHAATFVRMTHHFCQARAGTPDELKVYETAAFSLDSYNCQRAIDDFLNGSVGPDLRKLLIQIRNSIDGATNRAQYIFVHTDMMDGELYGDDARDAVAFCARLDVMRDLIARAAPQLR